MRILHVHHFLDMGGSETVVLTLAREQKRLGHDVTICCMFGEGPQDFRAAEYGIPVVHLRSKNKRIAKIAALYRYLGREKFDVLHSHWAVWLATAVAGFLRRIPVIHTNHSNQARRQFLDHRVACLFTDKVVSLTPFVEPYLTKWVAVPCRKIAVIPNGIDFEAIESASMIEIDGIPAEAPVVGMVARLSPPKDYATFIAAAEIVGRVRPDIKFISVGNGSQREYYEQLVREKKLPNFHFLGGRPDVASLLRRMAVCVLSTKHEGHPMSLVEALVSGCPCIGSDIPSVRFTLDEGRCGLLVKGGDAEALAEAVIRLVEDGKLRDQLSVNGRVFSQQFGAETMARSYLALYDQVSTIS